MRHKVVRTLLWLAALVMVVGAPATAVASGNQEQSAAKVTSFSWQNFSGQELHLMMAQKQWAQIVSPKLAEFEKLTGMKVIPQIFPENQFRQKLGIELASGSSSADVFMADALVSAPLYHKSGWIQPLNDLLKNANLTSPDFDYEDFLPTVKQASTVDGQILGIPEEVDGQILYYNTEIFQKYKLEPPMTLEGIVQVAKEVMTKSNGKTYGIVMRGMGPKAISQWSTFMADLGGWWVNGDGKADLTSQENIQAFAMYGDLLRAYGPPGEMNMDWPDALSVFAQGQAAMFCDAASFRKTVVDPSSSRIVGKWGAIAMPPGAQGTHPMTNSWVLSIGKNARSPDASWLLVQWLLSKKMVLTSLLQGIPSPRASAWKSDQFTSQDKYPFWTSAFMQNLKTGNPQFQAPVIDVARSQDIIGPVITTAIEGGDIRQAAEKANLQLQALIESEKKKYGNP